MSRQYFQGYTNEIVKETHHRWMFFLFGVPNNQRKRAVMERKLLRKFHILLADTLKSLN